MSTDDLTARVRDHLAHADTLPHGLAIALVSELADEVDQLRAENERLASIEFIHNGCGTIRRRDVQAVLEQRDAARAALERVRGVAVQAEIHAEQGRSGFAIADALTEALEGES